MTTRTTSPFPSDPNARTPHQVIVQMYLLGDDDPDTLAQGRTAPPLHEEYKPRRYTTSRHLIALQEAERESAAKVSLSALGYLGNLSALLIVKKELPSFYFKQAAQEIQAPVHVLRYAKRNLWNADTERWLTRIKREREPRRHHILEVMVHIYVKIAATPPEETFNQAMDRLQTRIIELKEGTETKGSISYNQMSQHTRIPYRPISDIAKLGHEYKGAYCPWWLLNKLQNAEEEITTAVHPRSIQNGVVRSEPGAKDPGLPSLPNTANQYIIPGQNCIKCGASWSHMYEDGRNAWDSIIYTCRTCGKNNPVSPPQDEYDLMDLPNPQMYIEKYDRCWNCQAPWHNFTRDGDDPWGNSLYVCVLCSQVNIVSLNQTVPAA